MTEEEARAWIAARYDHDACARLEQFLDLVIAENARQNLISPASVDAIWSRHAVDSAQLLTFASPDWRTWTDVGTGGGFPGMVVALLAPDRSVRLVEPRRKRADFLRDCCQALHLPHAAVEARKIEAVDSPSDVISARAVSSVENLLRAAERCAKDDTVWLMPRGRTGADDIASLSRLKRTMFHVEHSVTDPDSTIVVLRGAGR